MEYLERLIRFGKCLLESGKTPPQRFSLLVVELQLLLQLLTPPGGASQPLLAVRDEYIATKWIKGGSCFRIIFLNKLFTPALSLNLTSDWSRLVRTRVWSPSHAASSRMRSELLRHVSVLATRVVCWWRHSPGLLILAIAAGTDWRIEYIQR